MADIEVEESDLSAIIASEIRLAQTFDQTKRTTAIEYMRGEMNDLPARVNGSSQTDRTLATNISWVLPGTMRVFTASDQMVEFEATQEGGEDAADEASEYTNYSFFRENEGYRILYNATYDSLLFGNGAACSYWCPEERKTKVFRNKTEEELAVLLEEGWQGMGVPPKPGKPRAEQIEDPMTGETVDVELPTYTVRLQMVTERGQIRDMTLKPENLELSGTATTLEDARYRAYLHDDKTRSDLMEMADEYGWDKSIIEQFPAYRQVTTKNEVGEARKQWVVDETSPVASGDLMSLREIYIDVDKDGDGVAETLQVWCVGDAGSVTVLSEDEWEDDVPFTDIPCYPVPHQWEADGMYDRSADIMRVKTTLLRQLLDNTYAVGLPMQEVEEGSVLNPDIMVHPKFGGKIWKKRGSAPIVDHVIPFVGDKLMLALNYMDEQNAKRTGISKTTMALDPEALQNQTATASQQQRDAGYSQIELIARNMAELGWTKFFAKRRNLAKKYLKGEVKIPSKNGDAPSPEDGPDGKPSKYRTIQPEAWGDDMACTINVGLGTGSRDRDMAMLNTILNGQIGMADRLAAGGMQAKAIEFLPKIRKTAVQLAESSGLKNPDEYYPEITDEEVAKMQEAASQPQPDPAILLEQAKGQTAMQLKQVDAQVSTQTAQLKAQGDVVKNKAELEADLQTKEADRQNALMIERQKQQFEWQKELLKAGIEREKLAQVRELEILKLNAVEVADDTPGADGKPKGGKPKRRVVDSSQAIMEAVAKLGEGLERMSAGLNAPTEIVRGPDGRAVGTRKVVN